MRVNGHNGVKKLDFTHSFNLVTANVGNSQISIDWAKWKLHHLYGRRIIEGERKTIMDQIEAIRKRYKLKTLY